jgi:hypothetical protein
LMGMIEPQIPINCLIPSLFESGKALDWSDGKLESLRLRVI